MEGTDKLGMVLCDQNVWMLESEMSKVLMPGLKISFNVASLK